MKVKRKRNKIGEAILFIVLTVSLTAVYAVSLEYRNTRATEPMGETETWFESADIQDIHKGEQDKVSIVYLDENGVEQNKIVSYAELEEIINSRKK